jgi:predicted phosphodiesterase
MKLQLLSDLHLEAHPRWRAEPAAGADVLVLAGDIGSYQAGSLLTDDDFGLGQFSPQAGWPTPVIFVPGNHEYDTFDFDEAHARLKATCARLGLIWLEREVMLGPWTDVHGRAVRLVGTTLWSDFDAFAPQQAQPGHPLAQQLRARDKACRAANYYLRKAQITRLGQPFLAEQVRAQALVCQTWLREQLSTPFDGCTVVVTHFAPSLLSADPRYGLTPGTAGFCNGLDDLLPQAQLWLHGHLHAPSDYTHQGCRVVANPLGYIRKNEQGRFMACATVEV